MITPRLFIGPMSKEIVDSVINYANTNDTPLGLIPSRRQIDHDSGYVNHWTTETFCAYVRERTENVLLVRDHGGPNQGYIRDDGVESFLIDCQYFDVVHIDPFNGSSQSRMPSVTLSSSSAWVFRSIQTSSLRLVLRKLSRVCHLKSCHHSSLRSMPLSMKLRETL